MRAVWVVALMLSACCPKPEIVRPPPEIVEVVRLVVQPIPDEVLGEQPVVTGPLAQCPAVARARKTALQACNAQLRAIRGMQDGNPEE